MNEDILTLGGKLTFSESKLFRKVSTFLFGRTAATSQLPWHCRHPSHICLISSDFVLRSASHQVYVYELIRETTGSTHLKKLPNSAIFESLPFLPSKFSLHLNLNVVSLLQTFLGSLFFQVLFIYISYPSVCISVITLILWYGLKLLSDESGCQLNTHWKQLEAKHHV